jgi:hypothetical protein
MKAKHIQKAVNEGRVKFVRDDEGNLKIFNAQFPHLTEYDGNDPTHKPSIIAEIITRLGDTAAIISCTIEEARAADAEKRFEAKARDAAVRMLKRQHGL